MLKRVLLNGFIIISVLCFFVSFVVISQASDNEIYICKNKKTGNLRFVSSQEKCKSSIENLITLTSCNQNSQGNNGHGNNGNNGNNDEQKENALPLIFDNNHQFLGYVDNYMPGFNGGIKIYVPSIKKFIGITSHTFFPLLPLGEVASPTIYYANKNCTGKPYSMVGAMHEIFKIGEKYYTGKNILITDIQVESFWDPNNYSCYEISPETGVFVELTEINLPFSTPVAFPLRIE